MTTNVIEDYIKTLTPKERIALVKAKELLKDSFNIEKSIGFLQWKTNLKKQLSQLSHFIFKCFIINVYTLTCS